MEKAKTFAGVERERERERATTLTAKTENITGNLEWTSSNTDVATVSGNDNIGTVTLKAKGDNDNYS